jgi:hypothetical protein
MNYDAELRWSRPGDGRPLPIERLVEYPRNPRTNDGAVDRMCASIKEFGLKIPLLARISKVGWGQSSRRRWARAAIEIHTIPAAASGPNGFGLRLDSDDCALLEKP